MHATIFPQSRMLRTLLSGAAALILTTGAPAAQAADTTAALRETTGVRTASVVPAFSVFVDPATGYAFVKTPAGWRFRGQLSADRLDSLPPGTYTRLIAPISVGTGS